MQKLHRSDSLLGTFISPVVDGGTWRRRRWLGWFLLPNCVTSYFPGGAAVPRYCPLIISLHRFADENTSEEEKPVVSMVVYPGGSRRPFD